MQVQSMKLTPEEIASLESVLSDRLAVAAEYARAMQSYHAAGREVSAARKAEAEVEGRFQEAIDAIVAGRTLGGVAAAKGSADE